LEERLHRAGIPATGLWARVPPYLAGGTHPPAARALAQTLARLAGVEIETTELEAATKDHLEQVEQAIRERPQIAEFVEQIRGMVEQGADERIPSGDEIAAELERFLRNPPEGGRAPLALPQHVAGPADGVEQARLASRLQLAPQVEDVDLDHIGVGGEGVAPEPGQQLPAGHAPPGAVRER